MVKYIRWRYFGLPKANQSDLFGALLTAPEVQLVLGRLIKAQVKLQLFLQKFHNSKKEVFFGQRGKMRNRIGENAKPRLSNNVAPNPSLEPPK
jgi:hypothetical protein